MSSLSPYNTDHQQIRELLTQLNEKDDSIEKAAKVIEIIQSELERQAKELTQARYENEFYSRECKKLEKENIMLQKEANQTESLRKTSARQKQANHQQKEQLNLKCENWAEIEHNYQITISQLNQQIKALQQDVAQEQEQQEQIIRQYQVKENGFRDAYQLLQEKDIQIEQLQEQLNSLGDVEQSLKQSQQNEIKNIKLITENLFRSHQPTQQQTQQSGIDQRKITIKEQSLLYDQILIAIPQINKMNQTNIIKKDIFVEYINQMDMDARLITTMRQKLKEISAERDQLRICLADQGDQYIKLRSNYDELLIYYKQMESGQNVHIIQQPIDPMITQELQHNLEQLISVAHEQEEQNNELLEQLNDLSIQHTQTVGMLENAVSQLEQLDQDSKKYEAIERQNAQSIAKIEESDLIISKLQSDIEKLKQQQRTIEKDFKLKERSVNKQGNKINLVPQIHELCHRIKTEESTPRQQKKLEKQIECFLDQCSVPQGQQNEVIFQDKLLQQSNIMMGLVGMMIDSYHDMIQRLLISFLVVTNECPRKTELSEFEDEFHNLKSNRHKMGALDYLDQLEQMKNLFIRIVEDQLKYNYERVHQQQELDDGIETLISAVHLITSRLLAQVNSKDDETIMRRNKQTVQFKLYQLMKEQLLDFSEMMFEVGEGLRAVQIRQSVDIQGSVDKYIQELDGNQSVIKQMYILMEGQ